MLHTYCAISRPSRNKEVFCVPKVKFSVSQKCRVPNTEKCRIGRGWSWTSPRSCSLGLDSGCGRRRQSVRAGVRAGLKRVLAGMRVGAWRWCAMLSAVLLWSRGVWLGFIRFARRALGHRWWRVSRVHIWC